jgi:hypothetical protein
MAGRRLGLQQPLRMQGTIDPCKEQSTHLIIWESDVYLIIYLLLFNFI